MHVLFINSRLDARQNPGGDGVQLAKTRSALQNQGVDVSEIGPKDPLDTTGIDLVHVFNIQTPESAIEVAGRFARMPLVLSPIYWDVFGLWYDRAAVEKPLWRMIHRLAGGEAGRRIYVGWQERKAPGTREWQLQRDILQKSDAVLPNSKSEAQLLHRFFKLDSNFLSKVTVVPNGIDGALYQDAPRPSGSFKEKYGIQDFVLQVGTINPVKNQLGLIEALFDLPVPVVIIGHTMSAYRDYAEACKKRGQERGNTIFIDHLSHDELPGIYALARVHVLPSWRETPGLVSLEAAASGCQVVTTSIGSTRDYFGDLAWYCNPYDIRSIRTAVEAALATPKTGGLRQLILENYTWDHAAKITVGVYKRLLQN